MHQQLEYLPTITNNVITHAGVFGSIVYIQLQGLIGKLSKISYQIHIVKTKQSQILTYSCFPQVTLFQTMPL